MINGGRGPTYHNTAYHIHGEQSRQPAAGSRGGEKRERRERRDKRKTQKIERYTHYITDRSKRERGNDEVGLT